MIAGQSVEKKIRKIKIFSKGDNINIFSKGDNIKHFNSFHMTTPPCCLCLIIFDNKKEKIFSVIRIENMLIHYSSDPLYTTQLDLPF